MIRNSLITVVFFATLATPATAEEDSLEGPLKPEALEMLLSGIDLKDGMQRAWYELPDKS